ncbi:MAG: DUF1549 domain-containing protein [Acidobacteriaceae bacterium]|nr:DUF1549 domain-containing protein [Acidobacteriaceae bacterium]
MRWSLVLIAWAALAQPKPKLWWSFTPLRAVEGTIDGHVRAGLVRKGLTPNPRADARTLLRRIHYDLTGLPPTEAEATAFLADPNVPKLVDRLLASPHFGERWGRHWLDVARYGEDDFHGTAPHPYANAWRYRDWVVQAFNHDMPYDLFVKAQVAGDLLPEREKYLGGLGLFGLGPWYYGISQPPQARADERHDRIDMVTRGFLGITAACARCHDHKYDPISQRDYYALGGVFASTAYKEYPLAPKEEVERYEAHRKKIVKQEKAINAFLDQQREQLAGILAHRIADLMTGTGDLDAELAKRWRDYLAKPDEDQPFRAEWDKRKDRAAAEAFQQLVLAIAEEKKTLDAANAKLVARAAPPPTKRRIVILPGNYDSEADFNPGSEIPTESLERDRYTLWRKMFSGDGALLRVKDVDRFLSGEWKRHLEALRAELDRLKKASPPAYPFLHGVAEHEEPIDLELNIRGNPEALGPKIPRQFLTALGGESLGQGSGRLQLAEAIVRHPLAARVMANRIWAHLFGHGVVRTPSNFGLMGERPGNPELLEYLAARFVALRWSPKALIREIVLSETYQASSARTAAAQQVDPDNRLFWRAERRRLDAESMRDALLAVSGELEARVGGESAPLDDKLRRRTVYARVGRYQQNETLALFDFPSSSVSAEHRAATNVPLQRLFFLNSDFIKQRAAAFAGRAPSVERAYALLFQRAPSARERERGERFLAQASPVEYAQVLLSSNEFLYVD